MVVFERRDPVETLRYSIDAFDDRDDLIEVLGRVADLAVAHAAFEAAVVKYPDKRICLRQMCRVIRSSDSYRLTQGHGCSRDLHRTYFLDACTQSLWWASSLHWLLGVW